MICLLESKIDAGNNISRVANLETLGKHSRAMKVSGNLLPFY